MKRQLPGAARAAERRSNPRGTEETAVDPHVRIRVIQTQLHFAKGGRCRCRFQRCLLLSLLLTNTWYVTASQAL